MKFHHVKAKAFPRLSASILIAATMSISTDPAVASGATFRCPIDESPPASISHPELLREEVQLRLTDGSEARAYAGMMLPNAITTNPRNGHTYVAYYAADRSVTLVDVDTSSGGATTVAEAVLLDAQGQPERFDQHGPNNIDDSHDNVQVAVDRDGFVHVSGNVHNAPLTYWRSTSPDSVTTLRNKDTPGHMDGVWVVEDAAGREVRRYLASGAEVGATSYPDLFTGPSGDLFMSYRAGTSDRGNEFLYRYDADQKSWWSVTGESWQFAPYPDAHPFLQGISFGVGPYSERPVRGADGWWWKTWVWRSDGSDPDSNGRVSAAKSRDLVSWHTVGGTPLPDGVSFDDMRVVVDDAPSRGSGILNGQVRIGFENGGARPVISYVKNDGTGGSRATKLFVARTTGLGRSWVSEPVSNWQGVHLPGRAPTVGFAAGAMPDTTGTGDLVVRYRCDGNAGDRDLVVATRSFNGTSTRVSDHYSSSSLVPREAARRVTDSLSYPKMTPRSVSSPTFSTGDGEAHWLMAWDSGPYIVDGTEPTVDFPADGSPIRLLLVPGAATAR
jgi:hypothetical protein